MNIEDRIMQKWQKWHLEGNTPPNSLILSPEDFHAFEKLLLSLGPLDRNFKFYDMDVYMSKKATDVKIGILL